MHWMSDRVYNLRGKKEADQTLKQVNKCKFSTTILSGFDLMRKDCFRMQCSSWM